MKITSLLAATIMFIYGHATADTLDVCPTSCQFNSVAAAIKAAKNDDFIRVARSTYPETLVVNKNVILQGGYSGPPAWRRDRYAYPTILDGKNAGRVVLIPDAFSPTIAGFIITGGKAFNGAGVAIIGSSPKLVHNVIRNNQAGNYGGGLWIVGRAASPIVDGNQIIDNYAVDGGGVFINDYSSPLLTNNIIARNGALSNGDGLYIDYFSTPRIVNNTIVDNNRGNHRTSPEGLFLYNSPSPKILNNIIAKHHGCGIVGTPGPNSVLDYNVIWSNNASSCNTACGAHDFSEDPLFVTSDSNYHIQPNSFVIDKGTSEGAPLVDFDGERRPLNKGIDIGADENFKTSLLDPPMPPSLISPRNDSTEVATSPTFIWNAANGAGTIFYRLQVDFDSCFSSSGMRDQSGITATKFTLPSLFRNSVYFWRVNASNEGGMSGWSNVWKFKTTNTTAIHNEEKHEPPTAFYLDQNHPNPFNPATTIRYRLPKTAAVTLSIFNLIGEKIETLVSATQTAGDYEIQWHANHLPSGVYLYQLRAGKFTETKKMILAR